MPEEILNYVAPIATIPPQSLLAGQIIELRKKLARQRKPESIDMAKRDLAQAEQAYEALMKKLGRA